MKPLALLSLLSLFILSCSGEYEVEDQQEDLPTGIELIPLYKTQLTIYEQAGEDSTISPQLVLSELFNPNAALLRDCFGYTDSSYLLAQ